MHRFMMALGTAMCLGAGLFSPALAETPTPGAAAALVNVNADFRAAHAAARDRNLRLGGPIILVRNAELVLIRNGRETAVPVIPPEFDTYKTFAHLPVAVFLFLDGVEGERLDWPTLKSLRAFRDKLALLECQLPCIGLTGEAAARQQQILTDTMAFVKQTAARGAISREQLLQFTRSQTPLIQQNLAAAARAQIDGMNTQMQLWKRELSPEEWGQLRVAILGAVLARDGNLASQYFEWLLDLPGEETRLVYMERYFEPTPLQTLLTTRSVDQQISIAIFNNPERMFRDVLADAATAYLATLPSD